MTPDGQLEFGAGERAVELVDAVDVVLVVASDPASAAAGDIDGTPSSALAARNLFGEADRIAARAATTGTRRQYAAIYRTFAYWLREQLGRPPRVEDLDADVLVAYARHPAMGGGRGGTDRAGDRAREVLVPDAVQRALESWLKVHPLTRGVALRDEDPLFVRLGRHAHEDPVALSAEAVYHLVSRDALAAGIPGRLSHPHALRAYWATHCLEAGVPVHEVSARLGHVDLSTTARYAAPRPDQVDDIADVLDRWHQQQGRHAGLP